MCIVDSKERDRALVYLAPNVVFEGHFVWGKRMNLASELVQFLKLEEAWERFLTENEPYKIYIMHIFCHTLPLGLALPARFCGGDDRVAP